MKARRTVRLWLIVVAAVLVLATCDDDTTAPVGAAPEVVIEAPQEGALFDQSDEIMFRGSATDREDGDLTGSALVWSSSIDGTMGAGAELTVTDLSGGGHVITLTATDSDGREGSASINIGVQTPPAKVIGR